MPRRFSPLLIALTLPILLVFVLFYTVNTRAGGNNICNSGCTYNSIQAAVNTHMPEGDTLIIEAGTYNENVVITRSFTLVGAGMNLVIIDGQMTGTVVLVDNGVTVSLSGVTIQNGETTSVDGAGLRVANGDVTLSDSIVQNNLAPNGGGIANNSSLTLDTVTVRNNIADELVGMVSVCDDGDCVGGGIYNNNTGVLTITNSTLHGNEAQFGGGIGNGLNSSLTATSVELYGNEARGNSGDPSAGGGIENSGTMTLVSSTVRNNDAPVGAGIANGGTLTVMGSDIYENIAATQGGGLHNAFSMTVQTSNVYDNEAGSGGGGGISSDGGTVLVEQTAVYSNTASGPGGGLLNNVIAGANSLTITNSTISGNSAAGAGGGLRNEGVANTNLNNVTMQDNQAVVASGQSIFVLAGTVTLNHSIISTNQSGNNCSGSITSNGYNIAEDSSCNLTGTADLPNTAPELGPLQNNGGNTLTHALEVGSPAIDSGNSCPAVDQRGVARPVGLACDRGAYEFDGEQKLLYLPFVVRP